MLLQNHFVLRNRDNFYDMIESLQPLWIGSFPLFIDVSGTDWVAILREDDDTGSRRIQPG